jgi:hypothetical protein
MRGLPRTRGLEHEHSVSELILYTTEDGQSRIQLKVKRALKHYNLDVVPVVGYRYRRRLRSATSASISASEFHRSPCWLRS